MNTNRTLKVSNIPNVQLCQRYLVMRVWGDRYLAFISVWSVHEFFKDEISLGQFLQEASGKKIPRIFRSGNLVMRAAPKQVTLSATGHRCFGNMTTDVLILLHSQIYVLVNMTGPFFIFFFFGGGVRCVAEDKKSLNADRYSLW